jgi:deoxyribose-phosphate aldolase
MRLDRNELREALSAANGILLNDHALARILSLIDLTSLNDTDTIETTTALCRKAVTSRGHVAAVCVYPQFVTHAVNDLSETPVRIATVVNFPLGNDPTEKAVRDIQQAIAEGADEIDLVFPYARYLSGDRETARAFVQRCKATCGPHVLLKVILETGALQELPVIDEASYDAIMAGADFIKTSTGKLGLGATLEAAAVMLLTIRNMAPSLQHRVGFKASGGIRTVEQAARYVKLAEHIMGPEWVTPQTFRLGASQLVDEIMTK